MGCGGSFGSSRRARYENACTPLYDFNSYYDSSRHIEARHWLAQPSDNKICVSGNCFPSGGENNKIGGGVRGFSLSVSQGLSGKHNCFVGASLEPISRPTHALALRSAPPTPVCCDADCSDYFVGTWSIWLWYGVMLLFVRAFLAGCHPFS